MLFLAAITRIKEDIFALGFVLGLKLACVLSVVCCWLLLYMACYVTSRKRGLHNGATWKVLNVVQTFKGCKTRFTTSIQRM